MCFGAYFPTKQWHIYKFEGGVLEGSSEAHAKILTMSPPPVTFETGSYIEHSKLTMSRLTFIVALGQGGWWRPDRHVRCHSGSEMKIIKLIMTMSYNDYS